MRYYGFMTGSALLILAACSGADKDENIEYIPSNDGTNEPAIACAIHESGDWQAYIDRMPGPNATPQLTVSGQVTLPTPGYQFEWVEGPTDRSAIPSTRITLKAIAPEGMVAQVLDTQTISYRTPAAAQRYRKVTILCGDKVLAEITDIADVQ